MCENYALMCNRLPLATFVHKTDVCLASVAFCLWGSPCPEMNLWFLTAPGWLKKMLSLSFVIRAYRLCGQWRRKKRGILWNKARLCIILQLMKCGAICSKWQQLQTSVCEEWKELHLKVGSWRIIIFQMVFSFLLNFPRHLSAMATLLDEGNIERERHFWLSLLLKTLQKCSLLIWNCCSLISFFLS